MPTRTVKETQSPAIDDLETEPSVVIEDDAASAVPVTEDVSTVPINLREHMEATCIAFTRIYDSDGNEWSLTLREGITSDQLDQLLTAMEYTNKVLDKHGFALASKATLPVDANLSKPPTLQRRTSGQKPTPVAIEASEPLPRSRNAPSAPRSTENYEPINKIVIQPNPTNPSQPRVEFWSPKPQLKYAVTSAPAMIVQSKYASHYGFSDEMAQEELSYLYDTGAQWKVNWGILIEPSEALNRSGKPYKNVADIIDYDRE